MIVPISRPSKLRSDGPSLSPPITVRIIVPAKKASQRAFTCYTIFGSVFLLGCLLANIIMLLSLKPAYETSSELSESKMRENMFSALFASNFLAAMITISYTVSGIHYLVKMRIEGKVLKKNVDIKRFLVMYGTTHFLILLGGGLTAHAGYTAIVTNRFEYVEGFYTFQVGFTLLVTIAAKKFAHEINSLIKEYAFKPSATSGIVGEDNENAAETVV